MTTTTTKPQPPVVYLNDEEMAAFMQSDKFDRGTVKRLDDWVRRHELAAVRDYPLTAKPVEAVIVKHGQQLFPAVVLADGGIVMFTPEEADMLSKGFKMFQRMQFDEFGRSRYGQPAKDLK